SGIAHRREMEADVLFREAEEKERQGLPQQEVQQLFQRIETLYSDTDVYNRYATILTSGRPYILGGLVEEDYGALTLTVHGLQLLRR
ncbi:MAG: hypothetical protein JRC69_11440, partial [Deltaproteobacteria bacterium]|nr:hypothetical protein [Deltaproteobacteria bacterium]